MESMTTKKICVLGSANVDSFVYVHHIPVPGETIQATSYMVANGGKGANQAAAAAKLRANCIFTGQVGKDDGKISLQKEMEECGVKLHWIEREDVSTGRAFVYVDENSGENSIVIVGGANTSYTTVETLPEQYTKCIDECDYLLLQKEIPVKLDLLAAKYASSKGKIVVLDCGGADEPIPEQFLDYLDYISPNETQLVRLDETLDPKNLVEEVRNKLIGKHKNLKVLLKLGSKGAAMITSDLYIQCPTAPVVNPKVLEDYSIIDTVGAGDCFTAGFAVKHAELDWTDAKQSGDNYRKAMLFGCSSAFLCITKKGAMPSLPHRKDVEDFVDKYQLK